MIIKTLVKNSALNVCPGLTHGMCQTNRDVINADLLEFLRAK